MLKNYYYVAAIATIVTMSLSNKATAQKGTPVFQIRSDAKEDEDYVSKTIIFKMKPEYRSICTANSINSPSLNAVMQQMGIEKFGKIYPNEPVPERMYNKYGQKMVDITLIYEYTYTANIPLQQALSNISRLGIFEYAEPHVIYKSLYTVNDPAVTSSQYQIALIKCPQAWDISKGDTNVVIGIPDTGTDPTHPDLKNNIKHNYKDPINGIDDDGDGYIDNFSGWDLGENDNDPTYPGAGNEHGVHVDGCAAASTDNGIGGAGTGFKCKFLPIKIANAKGTLVASGTGVQYAASHGCKVINTSYGSTSGGSYGQDIIDYAVINNDVMVVSAAGNDGKDELFYPASYNGVISVAATTSSDKVASFSNYNYSVRICAPGNAIYSTWPGASYSTQSGTSMASPITAGAAAIVRSYYPSYNAMQAGARLCATADNIYSLNSSLYANKLGTGRVNLYRALSDPLGPSVSMISHAVTNFGNKAIVAGDTINITGVFENYLNPTTNLTATISSTSTYVSLITGTGVSTLGAIPTLGTKNNNSTPFRFRIKPTAPMNTDVIFQVKFTDGTYTYSQFFDVVVNVDYLNVAVNDISTSVTSRGKIGWNNEPPTQGLGFQYKGVQMTYETGFLLGIPDSAVSNCIRGFGAVNNADFTASVNARRIGSGAISDFDTEGYFEDDIAPTPPQPLPVLVHQKSYAWSNPGDTKYVMFRYMIHNKGTSPLSNLYAGLFADFDIQGKNGDSNRVAFDSGNKMGYTFYTKTNGLYGGIKLLSHTAPVNVYGIDNDTTGKGGINVSHGFSRHDKYITLSTMRTGAGLTGPGNDVLQVVSSGPFTLNAGDSVEVAFAMLAGDNLTDIQTTAVNAQTKYDGVVLGAPVITAKENTYTLQSYPNPATGITVIDVNISQTGRMELKLYDVIGKEAATIASGDYSTGKYQFTFDASKLNNGVYYYQLIAGDNKLVRKLIVSK